ncbi:hypothetical protein mRhiFer1_009958 [Rhinolophus ferrumequinum]|uniref:Uncharacterized protein n=1 Tax=Rhinolophus ferrumequinum TaxID=59479 RepID=A0A7J7YII9_RHIFE|nr:hypothetical protein mRhiFer1_009958 [Rhinolophus ferrumequinum]
MQNWLIPNLHVAVENKERYQLWRFSSEEGETEPNTGLSNPEYWCQEVEPLHLVVKNSQNSNNLGGTEDGRKPRLLFKGPVHRLHHSQALTLGSSGGTVTRGLSEICGGQTEWCDFGSRVEGHSAFPCVGFFSCAARRKPPSLMC